MIRTQYPQVTLLRNTHKQEPLTVARFMPALHRHRLARAMGKLVRSSSLARLKDVGLKHALLEAQAERRTKLALEAGPRIADLLEERVVLAGELKVQRLCWRAPSCWDRPSAGRTHDRRARQRIRPRRRANWRGPVKRLCEMTRPRADHCSENAALGSVRGGGAVWKIGLCAREHGGRRRG